MTASYKKLWKLLIDRDLMKKDLEAMAGISHYTINKLAHGEDVTTDVLGRICKALGCTMNDIMEFIDEQSCSGRICQGKEDEKNGRFLEFIFY